MKARFPLYGQSQSTERYAPDCGRCCARIVRGAETGMGTALVLC